VVQGVRTVEVATIDQTVDVWGAEWGASKRADLEGEA